GSSSVSVAFAFKSVARFSSRARMASCRGCCFCSQRLSAWSSSGSSSIGWSKPLTTHAAPSAGLRHFSFSPSARSRSAVPRRAEQFADQGAALRVVLDAVEEGARGARVAQALERLDHAPLRPLLLRLAQQLDQRVEGGRVLLDGQREGGGRRDLVVPRLER